MNLTQQLQIVSILKKELVPALGCTEPIAIAYAAAKARQVLGVFPEHINICCSGNIIKNVKGVMVPNSNGLKGVDVAAVLGVVGGDADKELEVLQNVTQEHINQTKVLLEQGYFSCELKENVANLYITATVTAGEHSASVTIINRHTLITEIVRDGEILYQIRPREEEQKENIDWPLSIREILEFAQCVDLQLVTPILKRQIEMNRAIAEVGLNQTYGEQVGKTLLHLNPENVMFRARAFAAAGSDARMGGCSLPVVINSGSGNQGMTVSLPVISVDVIEFICHAPAGAARGAESL